MTLHMFNNMLNLFHPVVFVVEENIEPVVWKQAASMLTLAVTLALTDASPTV